MRNLDRLAAQTAQRIIVDTNQRKASEVDNLATKALGVLQENGVYAVMLYLYSRSGPDKKIALSVSDPLLQLAAGFIQKDTPNNEAADALPFVTKYITNDLDTLLLVKQEWEQTLIYTRYGAKARGDGS